LSTEREQKVSFYPNHTQYTTSLLCVCFVRYLVVVVVVVREEKKHREDEERRFFFLCGSECVQRVVCWKHSYK
jgi:hypothetical protein